MADDHTVAGLVRKRAELAGEIEGAQTHLRQLIIDLDHLDATLRIFRPDIDLEDIRPKPMPPRQQNQPWRVYGCILRSMSGCRWRTYLAIGGLALSLTSPLAAQEPPERPAVGPAPIEEGRGRVVESPIPEDNSGEDAASDQPQPAESVDQPLTIENQQTAEEAAESRREAAENRGKADLVAQESMAESAEGLLGLTKWQLYVGGAGISLLVLTVLFSAMATNAAVKSNKIARKSSERQLRAYVSLSPAGIDYDPKTERLVIIVTQKNNGQTPARFARSMARIEGLPHPLPATCEFPLDEFETATNVVHPGHEFQVRYVCTDIGLSDFFKFFPDTGQRTYFFGAIEYEDVFEKRRVTRVCWSYDNAVLLDALEALKRKYETGHLTKSVKVGFHYADRYNTSD